MKNAYLLIGFISFLSIFSWAENPTDLSGDGIVDLDDLVIFASEWLNDSLSSPANFDGQGRVNLKDFSTLSANWLWEDPTAVNDGYSINQDAFFSVPSPGVLGNDHFPNGTVTSAVLVGSTSNGVLVLNSTGSITYTPNAGYIGTDTFTYKAYDGQAYSEPATVYLVVKEFLDNSNLLTNGDFQIGTPRTWHSHTPFDCPGWTRTAENGLWLADNSYAIYSSILSAGEQVIGVNWHVTSLYQDVAVTAGTEYTFSLDFYCLNATRRIEPSIRVEFYDSSDAIIGVQEEVARYTVASGGADNQWDTFSGVKAAPAGAVKARYIIDMIQVDASQPYPSDSHAMLDNASVAVMSQQFHANDDSYSGMKNEILDIEPPGVLSNDNGEDGAILTAELVDTTTKGTLTLNANGSFSYIPDLDFSGTDTFTYRLISNGTVIGNTATVTIYIVDPNPTAVDDSYDAAVNTTLNQSAPGVLANDSNPLLNATLVADVSHGTLTLNTDGSFTYIPDTDYIGLDEFTYKGSDLTYETNVAVVTINVKNIGNPGDVYYLDNNGTAAGFGIDGGTITLNSQNNTFTMDSTGTSGHTTLPENVTLEIDAEGYIGGASTEIVIGVSQSNLNLYKLIFDRNNNNEYFRVSNSGVSKTTLSFEQLDASVFVNLKAQTYVSGDFVKTGNGDVVFTESGVDKLDGTATIKKNSIGMAGLSIDHSAANFILDGGKLKCDVGDKIVGYISGAGRVEGGSDNVTFTAGMLNQDGVSGQILELPNADHIHLGSSATVSLDISKVNGVLDNDKVILGGVMHFDGTLSVLFTGSGLEPHDSFKLFSASSLTGQFDTINLPVLSDARVFWNTDALHTDGLIKIDTNNTAPVTVADAYSTAFGTDLVVNAAAGVLNNDYDIDPSDSITAALVSSPSNGTLLSFNGDGSFTYRPNTNFAGADGFTYRATDGLYQNAVATVTIEVAPSGSSYTFSDDFESPAWTAIANPAPGQIIDIASTVVGSGSNPNGWLFEDTNVGTDNVSLADGQSHSGPLYDLVDTTSLALNNYVVAYLPLPGVSAGKVVRVRFDYETAAVADDFEVALFDGVPTFAGGNDLSFANVLSQSTIDVSTGPEVGSVDIDLYTDGAASTIYFAIYKRGLSEAVHIDNVLIEETVSDSLENISDNFESAAWKAIANPSSGNYEYIYSEVINSTTNPNGWLFSTDVGWNSSYVIGNSATHNGDLTVLNTPSLGINNSSTAYLPLNVESGQLVRIKFDYEVVDESSLHHFIYGIWDGEPTFFYPTAIDLRDALQRETMNLKLADTLSGSVNTVFDTSGATGPVYFVLFREYKGIPIHIDNFVYEQLGVTTDTEAVSSGPNPQRDSQSFTDTNVTVVAASKFAGLYAAADRSQDHIEIRDVRGELISEITSSDILALMPWASLAGDYYGPCSLSFTPSGRQLFIGVCSASGTSPKDAILALNTNTLQLRLFDRLEIASGLTESAGFGMTHYKGNLYVGTESGLHRYVATMNEVGSDPVETIVPSDSAVIKGLALDAEDEAVYVATADRVYRLDRSVSTAMSLTEIVDGSDEFVDVAFGRVYGGFDNGGLYILERNATESRLSFIDIENVRKKGHRFIPQPYGTFDNNLRAIAATACGRLMLATPALQMLSDGSDHRLDFEDWMRDEYEQYLILSKGLFWPGTMPEGTVAQNQKLDYFTGAATTNNASWAIQTLLADYYINGTPTAEEQIRLILMRYANQLDSAIFEQTIDGSFYEGYVGANLDPIGRTTTFSGQLQAYAERAMSIFPNNTDIMRAARAIIDKHKRGAEQIRYPGSIYFFVDDYGPSGAPSTPWHELANPAESIAARDPFAYNNYVEYLHDVDKIRIRDYMLPDEPVIKTQSAFIIQHIVSVQKYLHESSEWRQMFRNYYSTHAAWTDDNTTPYLTVFSAGGVPESYNADNVLYHPSTVIHFPSVVGFSLIGDTSPTVGAYMAYRDGRRTTLGAANFLSRYSVEQPDWFVNLLGYTDFHMGTVALAELIQPGTVPDYVAGRRFYPAPVTSTLPSGDTLLEFSKLTRRHVRARQTGLAWDSLGFQYAPMTFTAGQYDEFEVIDPEGEFADIENDDFEDGLTGWTSSGDAQFTTADHGIVANGTSAEIHITTGTTSTESSLRQTLDVSHDYVGTEYIVRCNGKVVTPSASGYGLLRVEWDDNSTPGGGTIVNSLHIDSSTPEAELRIDTAKPSGKNYLHVYCVVNKGSGEDQKFAFDNVTVVTVGDAVSISNAGFESNDTGWTVSNGSYQSITTDPAMVLEGSKSKLFTFTPADTNIESAVYRDIDLSGDTDGTRYIIFLEARGVQLDASYAYFETKMQNSSGADTRNFNASMGEEIFDYTDGTLVNTLRKRPGEENLRIQIRSMRDDAAITTGTDQIIIDNLRIFKYVPKEL